MKKFVKWVLLSFFLVSFPHLVHASVITYERTSDNQYGVNKHWNVGGHNIDNVMDTPYVDATSKIYDFSDILTSDVEKQLYRQIQQFIQTTNMDMVIVTYNLPYESDSENEYFATDFYDYNDFGIDFETYSGVLLFRNTYERDRYYNIYTFGKAQLYFDFDRLDVTLDNMYSYFTTDDYLSGMSIFVDNMLEYYQQGIVSKYKDYYVDEDGYLQKRYVPPFFIAGIFSLVITTIIMFVLIKKNKMVKKASKADDYLLSDSIRYSLKEDQFIRSHTSSYRISSSSGGGSSGGSSGGGHSSGGGRHG
ncbi:MAG: TPM domain-containing protein [bacterium]|nr:TPM domain-containing protein [bacterium]